MTPTNPRTWGDSQTRDWIVRAALVLASGLAATWLALFAFRIVATPPALSNEAELMYEASRVARGLALYTDPLRGAFDDGPLPIRHFVLYGPIGPWLLSLIPDPARLIVARGVSTACWFLGIPILALLGVRGRRLAAVIVALSYASLFLLTRDVIHFTLTPIPVLVASVALVRVTRRGALDFPACLLFAVAWAMKPLVLGIALGAGLWTLIDPNLTRIRRFATAAMLALCFGATIAVLILVTHDAWLTHLRASTQNGILPLRWTHFLYDYFPILGLPHLVVGAVLWNQRAHRAAAATCSALVVSTLWAIFAMGKRGANAGYFMEPCAALVVAIAHGLPPRSRAGFGMRAIWKPWSETAALAVSPVLSLVASVPAMLAFAREDAAAEWSVLAKVRSACESAAAGRAIRAGLPSIELPLSGRITMGPWQHTVLVNRGTVPLQQLIDDLDIPALGCLVHTRGLDGPPPPELTDVGEFTFFDVLFDVKLREPIRERFEEFAVIGGLHLFRRRPR